MQPLLNFLLYHLLDASKSGKSYPGPHPLPPFHTPPREKYSTSQIIPNWNRFFLVRSFLTEIDFFKSLLTFVAQYILLDKASFSKLRQHHNRACVEDGCIPTRGSLLFVDSQCTPPENLGTTTLQWECQEFSHPAVPHHLQLKGVSNANTFLNTDTLLLKETAVCIDVSK